MSLWLAGLCIGAYFCLIFWFAHRIDHRPARPQPAWVYSLSLAVFCTSWTFYGSIGRAASSGWSFLPIYVGPALVFLCAQPFLQRLLHVCKSDHLTSIADLIAARHGKSPLVGAAVTLMALVGVVPYIALQLKAMSDSVEILNHYPLTRALQHPEHFWQDIGFWVALLMAAFVILFGTRQTDASEQHRGMVGSVALESVVKLLAFVLAGGLILYAAGGWEGLSSRLAEQPQLQQRTDPAVLFSGNFWLLSLLAGLAIFCLPRQFQVGIVENTDPAHLRASRWQFPLYLLLINLLVMPLALTGLSVFGSSQQADGYLLALPLQQQQPLVALLVFLGGVSAATAMIIVETIALATMASNNLLLPLLIRRHLAQDGAPHELARLIRPVRQLTILLVVLASYAFMRLVGASYSLVSIGLISFVAVAQFAPAILGALYWRQRQRNGALAGLLGGFSVWAYTLLLPAVAHSGGPGADILAQGLFGLSWLRPEALFGASWLEPATHALVFSLLLNSSLYIAVPLIFKNPAANSPTQNKPAPLGSNAHLLNELAHFFPAERLQAAQQELEKRRGQPLAADEPPDELTRRWAETQLTGLLGPAMARVVIAATLARHEQQADTHALLDAASQAIQANWDALRTTLDHLGQGVCMFDAEQRLAVWNARFFELMQFPLALERVGTALEEFIRHEAVRGGLGAGKPEALIQERLHQLAERFAILKGNRTLSDGRIVEWQWRPVAHGGLVGTFTDVTTQKRAEQWLEEKVTERTEALRQSERRLHDFASSASDWFWETDAEFRFTHVSERFFDYSGMHPDQVLGQTRWSLAGHADSVPLPPHLAQHQQAMHRQEAIRDFEYQLQGSTGKELHLRVSGQPWYDSDGRFCGYRGTGSDITELVNQRNDLLRSERMATLGGLVAGVAHEINTPIGVSVTANSVLEDELKHIRDSFDSGKLGKQQLGRFLDLADESVSATSRNLQRAAELVRSFKEVAVDQTTDEKRRIEVGAYLEEIRASLVPALKRSRHQFRIECPELIQLETYPGALAQIVTNLVNNSLLHGFDNREEGDITLRVLRDARGQVHFDYQDNGHGMDPATASRIFDPFFTTRRGSGGSGLGMHIVYNLVTQKLGGSIRVDSAPGLGCRIAWDAASAS
ncbi:PAS-domain containing protein [Chitinilyticum piscinae]|uniref:histidine kinase n=1 Tax=Chitinilyticum piscinae TaxID=2866724 RepID=A0A8J7FQT1_9NEIS|nr:PAS-domain containing protein [Chitinilyticum piscinae]MBE9609036.1 PAS-domain containing protein [Chitinilyticum piscinae]